MRLFFEYPFLYTQMEKSQEIFDDRMRSWKLFYELLESLKDEGKTELQIIPEECEHNAHMFYIKVKDLDGRTSMISCLKDNGINAVVHYAPLYTVLAGKDCGRFYGADRYTTRESERLIR